MITAFALKGLSEIKFKQFFSDYINPLYFCSLEAESVSHFFLHFHYFSVIRTALVNELSLVDPETLILNDNEKVEFLLHGSSRFKVWVTCKFSYAMRHNDVCWWRRGLITNDELESSCIVIWFSHIYLIIYGKRSFINYKFTELIKDYNSGHVF